MLPPSHPVTITLVDQSATDEGAEKLPPHQRLPLAKSERIKPGRRVKDHAHRFVHKDEVMEKIMHENAERRLIPFACAGRLPAPRPDEQDILMPARRFPEATSRHRC